MSIITKMWKQAAIYWAFNKFDEYGQPEWSTPVEISCRWEDVSEEFILSDGTKIISRSVVYVDRDMVVGSLLKLGELDTGIDQDHPKNNDNVFEVQKMEKLPNLKATEFLRTAIL